MAVTFITGERFPEPIKELFSHFAGQAIHAHAKWTMFRHLYVESPKNIELLNRTAPGFFALAQQALFDDMIVSLLRMLDPPSIPHSNPVLQRLLDSLSPEVKATLEPQLKYSLDCALSTAQTLRHHRNKRIAHQDLNILLSIGDAQLDPTSCAEIRQTLEHIEAFLGTIYAHFTNSVFMWDVADIRGGSDSLLDHLRMAQTFGRLKKNGKIPPSLWKEEET
jgi:hypothetical protein